MLCPGMFQPRVHPYTEALDMVTIAQENDVLFFNNTIVSLKDNRIAEFCSVSFWPTIYFAAFHPDIVYARTNGKILQSALGDYNSSLVLYGWRKGLTAERIVRLFDKEVFDHLGFSNYWDGSKSALIQAGIEARLPLDDFLRKWSRQGCFMHTVNHPKITVLGDVAFALLQREGLDVKNRGQCRYLFDGLGTGHVWPLYPGIIDASGVEGSFYFKVRATTPSDGRPVILDLEEFVEKSLESYASIERSDLICPRIDSEEYRSLDKFCSGRRPSNGPIDIWACLITSSGKTPLQKLRWRSLIPPLPPAFGSARARRCPRRVVASLSIFRVGFRPAGSTILLPSNLPLQSPRRKRRQGAMA